jgi:uncharacterized membrane protein
MQEQPLTTTNLRQSSKSIGITSLILGIIATLLGLIAVISIPLGIAAIVTGVVSLKRRSAKGMAIAGIITGAIGIVVGLIGMLLVFIAVPSLQRNQRDIQVKNDMATASSAVTTYRSNNNGVLPTEEQFNSSDFRDMYMNGISTQMEYVPGSDCEGNDTGSAGYSVSAPLEIKGTYCLD